MRLVRPVTIVTKGSAQASADFTSLDAREYMRRAGYAP